MKRVALLVLIATTLLVTVTAAIFAGETSTCTAPADECVKKLHAKLSQVGWLGIEKEKAPEGAKIIAVVPGSPAAAAGFEVGDVIVGIDGIDLNDLKKKELQAKEAAAKDKEMHVKVKMTPGSTVTYTVLRNGVRQNLIATLGPMPESEMAKVIGEHMLHSHVK